jgi:thiol:disulfide interchange protein
MGIMKHLAFTALLLLALALDSGCEIGIDEPPQEAAASSRSHGPATTARAGRGGLQFVEGFAQGRAESVRQSKPMLLFFTADWCAYCRQMAAEAFTHPQVVSLSKHFVCVLIDADSEPEVCRQFEVTGYPTIQFLSPRGVPLNRMVGKQPGHQVMMAMQAALQQVARRTDAGQTRLR